MSKKDSLTPGVLVAKIRENQNNNKTIKALFGMQFFGKFSTEELEGLKASIDKEIGKRQEEEVNQHIKYLEQMGYKVSK